MCHAFLAHIMCMISFFFCSFCVRECSFLCACASIIKIIQSPSPFPQKKSKQVQPLKGMRVGIIHKWLASDWLRGVKILP